MQATTGETSEPDVRVLCLLGMGRCSNTAETKTTRGATSLAKTLAPEDVRCGDFVTPLYVVSEWPSWYWDDDDALHPRDELVRIRSVPCDEATPLEVVSVCLPFVLVKTPEREGKVLDIRRMRLARLDHSFAKQARRELKKREKRQEAKSKK